MNTEEFAKAVRDFDKSHVIQDIVLLGMDGAIRRIVFNVEMEDEEEPF